MAAGTPLRYTPGTGYARLFLNALRVLRRKRQNIPITRSCEKLNAKELKKKYIEYANGYAIEMFEDFKNHPEWRGSNFTWDIFPNMVGRFARANCRLSYPNISINLIKTIKGWKRKDIRI